MAAPDLATRRAGSLRLPALRVDTLVLIAVSLFIAYLTLIPLGMLVLGSVSEGGVLGGDLTFRHFARVLTDANSVELLMTSFGYSLGAAGVAFVLGTAMAWVVERSDVPYRNVWYGLALVPLIIPGIIHTIAWLFLLSPEIGWINAPLKALTGQTLSIYTLGGMIWVQGLHEAPLAFVLMSAAFRAMDPSLEEAAATARAGTWKTLRRVTLPLLLPTAASVILVLFVRALESFEVPAIIGLPARLFVYTSRVYTALHQYPPNYGLSASYAMVLLGISVMGLVAHRILTRRSERFATITGKAYRPRRVELGRFRFVAVGVLVTYAVLAIALPFLVLLYSSFVRVYTVPTLETLGSLTLRNYAYVLEDELTRRAILNSIVLGVSTATAVVGLTAVIGWITVRSRTPGRGILDFLSFVPIAIPGIVLGISLIWVYFTIPIRIYGTMWILLVAYITRFLPYGIRSTTAGLVQIHKELEEAASASGASWWSAFRRVTLPLLRPALVAAWIYVFIVSLRELSSSILLYSTESVVLSIRIFDMRDSGQYTAIAALSVMLITFLVILVAVLQRLGGRTVRES
ncbi:MAG TPA: iron ABC transporter permease [Candidatus Limnocylindria bacterium]|nr:iron ABC transporter permease [Candidatus Limnocylindria bacterium]